MARSIPPRSAGPDRTMFVDGCVKRRSDVAETRGMNNSRRMTLKSLVAASAATALLGVAAVPVAQAAPRVKDTTTDTTTIDTTTDTTTTDTTTTTTKDTKTSAGGRKVG